jgi:short-subunit dehydrogenase
MSQSVRHAAITGASSGIGEALVREFARAGYRVSMIARRRELLASIAASIGGSTFIRAQDLSDIETSTDWISAAEEALGPIDVLINNAGMQMIGSASELPLERLEAMVTLNLLTPLRITRAVLAKMRERGQGTIVDVASMAAIAPTPFMGYYSASKAGLAAYSESLRGELLGTGVHVVTVYPGPVDTPMGTAGYAAYEDTAAVKAAPLGTPAALARLVRRAVERRRPRVIYPRFYAIARYLPGTTRFFLDRFTPRPRTLGVGAPENME